MKRYFYLLLAFFIVTNAQAQDVVPKAKVYLDFVVEEKSVDPSDALDMFKKEITKLTSLEVVDNKTEAELEFKLHVLKSFGDIRKACIECYNNKSGEKFYETKWQKSGSGFANGMSGTRGSIVASIKKQLLKKYPNIRW